jgi:hypothetical protein
VDFYHTTGHLSKAAEAIFGEKSPRGHPWYDTWREALKDHSLYSPHPSFAPLKGASRDTNSPRHGLRMREQSSRSSNETTTSCDIKSSWKKAFQ